MLSLFGELIQTCGHAKEHVCEDLNIFVLLDKYFVSSGMDSLMRGQWVNKSNMCILGLISKHFKYVCY